MRYCFRQLIYTLLGALVLLLVAGCERSAVSEQMVLKVGVIASLSGPERLSGETTVECARVIAEYHNEQGGFEIDGVRYQIELQVEDDAGDPMRALEIASNFVSEGEIHYVIGPEGAAICDTVAPVLDSADILYVYYGISDLLTATESSRVLGEPPAGQLFADVADYLEGNEGVSSICVLAGNSRSAMHLKWEIERAIEDAGMDVIGFSRFDVAEEVFDVSGSAEAMQSCMASLVTQNPGAVILCGLRDGTLSLALSYLRASGYSGPVIAREPQNLNDFEQVRLMADKLFLVGISAPLNEHSDYYLNLKDRYLDRGLEWHSGVDTKLYALEGLLSSIAQCGRDAVSSSELVIRLIDSIEFEDPFLVEERLMGLVSGELPETQLYLPVPILITKYSEGNALVVHRSNSSH